MNKVSSIKSGKTVGSGKSLLLTFLAMSISRRRENFIFGIHGLEGDDFISLISECPPTLERPGINRKPTFPLFPQGGEEIGQRTKNDGNHLTLTISSEVSGIASTRLLARF